MDCAVKILSRHSLQRVWRITNNEAVHTELASHYTNLIALRNLLSLLLSLICNRTTLHVHTCVRQALSNVQNNEATSSWKKCNAWPSIEMRSQGRTEIISWYQRNRMDSIVTYELSLLLRWKLRICIVELETSYYYPRLGFQVYLMPCFSPGK